MEKFPSWLLDLTLVMLMSACHQVRGEFFVISGPEHSQGSQLKARDMYCLTNDMGSALSWNSNLEWDVSRPDDDVSPKPLILHNDNNVYPERDSLNCQMGQRNECSKTWTRIGNWSYVDILDHPMAPVLDNRWEDFPMVRLGNEYILFDGRPNPGVLTISIRGDSNVRIKLSEAKSDKQFSVYVTLGPLQNTISINKRCEGAGLDSTWSLSVTDECETILASNQKSVLSSIDWITLVIKWQFAERFEISVENLNEIFMSYSTDKGYELIESTNKVPMIFAFAKSDGPIFIKMHNYGYSMTLTTKSKLISADIMSQSQDRNMCIEMSISLCENCLMFADFVDSSGTQKAAATFTNKLSSSKNGLPAWRNVKINKTLPRDMDFPVKLLINTLSNTTKNNKPFWAISNIRRCYNSVYKAIKIRTYNANSSQPNSSPDWPKITCQKLNPDGSSTVIDSVNRHSSTPNLDRKALCQEGKVGSSCQIRCSDLFIDSSDCKQLHVCDQIGCSCAQGFKMPQCTEQCPELTYGHECQRKCGHCAYNNCNAATGECKYGCKNTDKQLYLLPYCKFGIGSPSAPIVESINSTCVRVYLKMKPEYKAIDTVIRFEIRENATASAIMSDEIIIDKNTINIDFYAEHLTPGTRYNAIGIVYSQNHTFFGESTNFTTQCTESTTLNFVTMVKQTSIILDNKVDVHVNDSCPQNWYNIKLMDEKNETLFVGSSNFPRTFEQLEPFSYYNVIIKSNNNTLVDRMLRTLEGVPDAVQNLSVKASEDQVLVDWLPPNNTRGKIVNYTVEIRPIEFFGCEDMNSSIAYDNYYEKPLKIGIIKDDQILDSYNYTFDGLMPYTKYLINVFAANTRYKGEIISYEIETPASKIAKEEFSNLRLTSETSSTTAAYLRWDPPEDCTKIRGPTKLARVSIRRNNGLLVKDVDGYSFPLEKLDFNGTETYEVNLYPLRELNGDINETAFSNLTFTMPPRAPPPVQNLEVIEIIANESVKLRWDEPKPPHNGQLEFYSVIFCRENSKKTCNEEKIMVYRNQTCGVWNSSSVNICATIPLPNGDFNQVLVSAHNNKIAEPSEPVMAPLMQKRIVPSPPQNLSLNIEKDDNSTVKVTWNRPLITGGKLEKYVLEARLLNSSLKIPPWKEKTIDYEVQEDDDGPLYSYDLNLFPSSTFSIAIKAVTVEVVHGKKSEVIVELDGAMDFNINNLKIKMNGDSTLSITIPKINNEVEGSSLTVVLQGFRFCEDTNTFNVSKRDNLIQLPNILNSSHYESRLVATFEKPDKWAGREFIIGHNTPEQQSNEYKMCENESYSVHLILAENLEGEKRVVRSINSDEVLMSPSQHDFSFMWLIMLFAIILALIVLIFLCYHWFYKKCAQKYERKRQRKVQTEHLQLSPEIKTQLQMNEDEVESIEKEDFDSKCASWSSIIDSSSKINVKEFYHHFEYVYMTGKLHDDYNRLKRGPTKPCTVGSHENVESKNRYSELIPYDENRVILPGDGISNYINASYIRGHHGLDCTEKKRAYIATQAPMNNTVNDFWKMIWQDNVKLICMLMKLVEGNEIKCQQYWPSQEGETVSYGNITIKLVSEEEYFNYTDRIFKVTCAGSEESRKVRHLQFTTWPDEGVPENIRSLAQYLVEVRTYLSIPQSPEDAPLVVHCTDGIGRTGTFIVLDMCIAQAILTGEVDIFPHIFKAREDRINMVDKLDQYLLIHVVLLEFFTIELNTCFECDSTLAENIFKAKQESSFRYRRITHRAWYERIFEKPQMEETKLSARNKAKHRFPDTARNAHRLYLNRSISNDPESDYLAASFVRGIFKDRNYIATQLPMPTTAGDFWRMLSEQNVEHVLVLQLPDLHDPSYCELVPDNKGYAGTNYIKVIRQAHLTEDFQYYLKEEVLIIDSSKPSRKQIVKFFSYKNWTETPKPCLKELLHIWRMLEYQPRKIQCPIVVVCRDGVTASGFWLTMSLLFQKMIIDRKCDPSEVVRTLRRHREDFFNRPEYLDYLYDAVLAWILDPIETDIN